MRYYAKYGSAVSNRLYRHPEGHVFYRHMSHGRPKIAHGHGVFLVDENGREYLDGSGGPLVTNVGHGRMEVIRAIEAQAAAAAYVHAMMFTSDPVERYAAALAERVPLEQPRFFFLSSGSEVVEAAIKLARQIQMARGEHDRDLIISRWQSYHGMTLGALASSGRPGLRAPYRGMMPATGHIRPPYPYRDDADGAQLAGRLEKAILGAGPENVAAFIAEPISGAGLGAIVPPDDYWPRIRAICDRYGVLLIIDEVLVGLGRTGRWWAIDHWAVRPDIMVASKGLAGGYVPLGFLAASGADISLLHEELGDFNHGGTFSHHPVATAAGLAVLNIIIRESLVDRAAELGPRLESELRLALADHPHVGDIRGRGLFWALEIVQDKATKIPFPAARRLAPAIWQRAFEQGLILYYSQGCANGRDGDLILIGPPFIITAAQCELLVTRLRQAVHDVLPIR